jgi:hypothetical protein
MITGSRFSSRRSSQHCSAQGGPSDADLRSALANCRRALLGETPLHLIGADERLL